ncbi:Histidine kinase [Xylographa parallela]|nr:Histidine kinase [Xylographa parallela]
MRVNIREQLGLLTLLCSLIGLAVIAIATWETNYNYVVGIGLSSLSLTASLYSEQLLSNLVLLESSVQAVSTRVLIQNALQRYNDLGNDTDSNWVRAQSDLMSALAGGGASQYLFQARVFSKNGTGINSQYGLINVTGAGVDGEVTLPFDYNNGSSVYLGDDGEGYPTVLYPNFTYTSTVVNSTFNISNAFYDGHPLYPNSTLVLGPWQTNESFALLSITMPIINNTSAIDILGWLTVVANAQLLFNVENALEGLGNTGVILIIGPDTMDNKFPSGIKYNSRMQLNKTLVDDQEVRFILPPVQNSSRSTRHSASAFGQPDVPFPLKDYPAAETAVTINNHALNNAGSLVDSTNEESDSVAVGFSYPQTNLVDWIVLVEQDNNEILQPTVHLRNVLLACVFGTTGGIMLLLIPIAHYSVRPIRRLRAATKRTVDPYGYPSDSGSVRSSISGDGEPGVSGDEENMAVIGRKEGFMGPLSEWRTTRRKAKVDKRIREDQRRETFRIPGKVLDRKHFIHDELTDLTTTFNEMSEELMMQYERLEEKVRQRTHDLELSKKAAEAANESKTLFIANISHELKTPLNGIMGMCAVCMQEEDHTKIKRSLGIIYKSGDLLLHLLTDLLTFSKNQIGRQLSLDEKEFRIADISSQILSIFEKQAKEGSISLRVVFEGPHESLDTASGTPGQSGYGPYGTGRVRDMCLWGDQHRILQVVINLVNNSLKFTPPGGSVDVHIRCVGEIDAEKAPSSRKGSTQSKQSRQSKQHSSRTSRTRARGASDNQATSGTQRDGELSKNTETALQINSREPKYFSESSSHERSLSPPPINARTLVFEFEVIDTGPGIPPEQQKKVFEPFVQGDLGLSRKYGGTGLGLSICSQLASLMRGSITLNSEVGVGSAFTMRIPLKFTKERADSTTSSHLNLNSRRNSVTVTSLRDEPHTPGRSHSATDLPLKSPTEILPVTTGFDSPASKPRLVGLSQPFFATSPPLGETPKQQLAAMDRVTAEATRSGDKVRVLVAEDNIVNQEVVLRMLKLEDIYDVTVAKDGQEAFDLVKESMEQNKLFNLVFMDIQMPNLDGLQSTRLIREMGFSAPIVALTAFAEESNVKECLDSGMDFFLPKPIRRPALKQVLKRYCATIEEAPEEPESPPMDTKSKTKKPEIIAQNSNTDSSNTLADKEPFEDDAISPLS